MGIERLKSKQVTEPYIKEELEMMQKRAARFVYNVYDSTAMQCHKHASIRPYNGHPWNEGNS